MNDKEFASLNPEGFSYGDSDSIERYQDITSSVYGLQNVFEDAAYVMGDLILTFPQKPLESLSQTQKEKVTLGVSRIEILTPEFAHYFKGLNSMLSSNLNSDN